MSLSNATENQILKSQLQGIDPAYRADPTQYAALVSLQNPDEAAPIAAEKQVIEPVVGDQNIVPVGKIKQDDKATQKEVVEPNAALVSNMDTQKVEPAILTSKIEDEKTKQAAEPEKIQ